MHHHHHEHMQHLLCDAEVTKYIRNLFAIELLRKADPWNVTLEGAWLYGTKFGCSWAIPAKKPGEIPGALESAKEIYRDKIIAYQYERLLHLVHKLNSGVEDLCSPTKYRAVALDQNLITSILSNLNAICERDFRAELLHVDQMKRQRNTTYKPRIRNSRTLFGEFENIDRMLVAVFDMWTEDRRDLDNEKAKAHYGVGRHDALDNKMYKCIGCLEHMYGEQLKIFGNQTDPALADNFTMWASVFSMLYRLNVPRVIHPNSLNRLYEKYITRNEGFPIAISKCRCYSVLDPVDVVSVSVEDLCPMITDGNSITSGQLARPLEPESLVEKYLVCDYLVNHPDFAQPGVYDQTDPTPGQESGEMDQPEDHEPAQESPVASWMFS